MKRFFYFVLLSGFSFFLEATEAQPKCPSLTSYKTMAVKIQPALLILGVADVQIDLKIKDQLSLVFALDGGYLPLLHSIRNYYGLGGGVGINWRLTGHHFDDGWFLKPMVRVISSNLFESSLNLGLLPSVELGHAWYWPSGFLLSLGLDMFVPIRFGKIKSQPSQPSRPITPVAPLLNFGLGYAW